MVLYHPELSFDSDRLWFGRMVELLEVEEERECEGLIVGVRLRSVGVRRMVVVVLLIVESV